jgi:hypothetical protein
MQPGYAPSAHSPRGVTVTEYKAPEDPDQPFARVRDHKPAPGNGSSSKTVVV